QGMVCHETYKSTSGNWLLPEQVKKTESGALVDSVSGEAVTLGRVEKMSKSKKNVVDPRHIIESYGADTARLFMMSDSPPERDLEWTDAGIDGAWRYVNKLWRLLYEHLDAIQSAGDPASVTSGKALEIRKKTHQTIEAVTQDIEAFHYNKMVAHIRELSNLLGSIDTSDKQNAAAFREGIEVLIHLIAPLTPHLAEAMWQTLGHDDLVALRAWPETDSSLLVNDVITIAVQVNGKVRATMDVSPGASREELEKAALEQPNVIRALEEKSVRKVITVPGKIVNVVAA
ncbi:MAG: class I tRNA ligase family protein, partial [Leptospiraceae bacterium]|nr:class I tRNA ligase family protein [Leptospiraceae bacterium]